MRFVRDQRWKLYGVGRFYDIAADPLEKKTAATTARPAAAQAHAKLADALKSMPSKGQSLLKFTR